MTTRKKTVGKTTKKSVKNLNSLLSWFEESDLRWEQEGESIMFSDDELKLITECKAKCYSGEYGDFVKLYVSIAIDGKILTLKGDEDSSGRRRAGIKLDVKSTKLLDLEEGEEVDVDPEEVLFYNIVNVEDGEVRRRVRILNV